MTELPPESVGDIATTRPDDAESSDPSSPPEPTEVVEPVDLDAIERDLAGVERALERLSDGTYWTDEATGEAIPDSVLEADPTVRRA